MILPHFDKNWTLFLDRDGVINRRIPGAYVKTWEEFEFLPGVLEALAIFNKVFGRMLIVTNQQGIGKGLMTISELNLIHQKLRHAIEKAGSQIDGIYYCPDLKTIQPNCRKPNPAMAIQAQADFPEIDFQRSVMVGDSISDIEFGQRLGMFTVHISGKKDEEELLKEKLKGGFQVDFFCDGLLTLSKNMDFA